MRFWEFEGNDPTGKPLRWWMVEAVQGKWGTVIAEFEQSVLRLGDTKIDK